MRRKIDKKKRGVGLWVDKEKIKCLILYFFSETTCISLVLYMLYIVFKSCTYNSFV